MRVFEVSEIGSDRHDTGGIDVSLAVVSGLDLLEIEGLSDPGRLIKLAQIFYQMTIVLNPAQIAFEMTVVNQIEAQQGGKGTPVRFGDSFAGKITSLA